MPHASSPLSSTVKSVSTPSNVLPKFHPAPIAATYCFDADNSLVVVVTFSSALTDIEDVETPTTISAADSMLAISFFTFIKIPLIFFLKVAQPFLIFSISEAYFKKYMVFQSFFTLKFI